MVLVLVVVDDLRSVELETFPLAEDKGSLLRYKLDNHEIANYSLQTLKVVFSDFDSNRL